MSRPTKNGLDYFPHDTDMSEDEKIQKLEFKFGLQGYAIYNKILERVYRSDGKFIPADDDDFFYYSGKWNIELSVLRAIMDYMVTIGLFPEGSFMSEGVKRRICKINEEREKKRRQYKKKTDIKPTTLTTPGDSYLSESGSLYLCGEDDLVSTPRNTGETQEKPDKVKESKLKEIKEKKKSVCVSFSSSPYAENFAKFRDEFWADKLFESFDAKYYGHSVVQYKDDYKKDFDKTYRGE